MKTFVIALVTVVLLLGQAVQAQEHPEHPEHPEKKAAVAKMTLEDLATAITGYIATDAKLKGGSFLIMDAKQGKVLQLELVKVHKERLSSLGDGIYFACTDMKTSDGTVYDLDFFMKETEHGIKTTEISIHKQSGKARYGWREENGLWKKTKS